MSFMDHFKRKNKKSSYYTKTIEDKNIDKFLKQEMFNIMMRQDITWNKNWIKNKAKNDLSYLPCHLNNTAEDIAWIRDLVQDKILSEKDTYIPTAKLEQFLRTNKTYGTYKYLYQLRVARSLIEHIMDGGKGWIKPHKKDETYLDRQEVDTYVREGIVSTLSQLGFDNNIIEAGIEKHSDLWLEECMNQTFSRNFEPVDDKRMPIMPASKEHKENWLALRKHDYYLAHKDSVNKYGEPNNLNLKIAPEKIEAKRLKLAEQNAERREYILDWLRSETISNYPF